MPLKTRQILGQAKAPQDLLDLPEGAESTIHRLTYLGILTRFSPDHVMRTAHPDFNWPPRKVEFEGVKTTVPGLNPKLAEEFKPYLGSSLAAGGGRARSGRTGFLATSPPRSSKSISQPEIVSSTNGLTRTVLR